MPPVQLPFPITALPGRRPGEGQGDLLNVFARKVGNLIRWQRVPGAMRFTPPMFGDVRFSSFAPRGQLPVDQYLLSVWGDKVTRTLANGSQTMLTGTPIPGTGPVTLARNLQIPPQVVVVADNKAFAIDIAANTVSAISDLRGGAARYDRSGDDGRLLQRLLRFQSAVPRRDRRHRAAEHAVEGAVVRARRGQP